MIYTGLNRTGEIETVKANGGAEVAAVYGGIGNSNPIYYKQREMVGTIPMQFKALGLPLKDYLISGNTLQDGTPSPDMPVDVVGCGVRTENYFNIADVKTYRELTVNGDTITKGNTAYNTDVFSGISGANSTIPTNCMVLDAGDYAIFYNTSQSTSNRLLTVAICPYTSSTMAPEVRYYEKGSGFSFTLSEKSYVTLRIVPNSPVTLAQLAITSGSQSPTSYIPYGYKLPLTVNDVEYPIYLGQVETTRKIKKQVLTGEEDFTKNYNQGTSYLYYAVKNRILPFLIDEPHLLCNELPVISSRPPETQIGINASDVYPVIYFNFGADIMDAQPSGNTVAGLKEYLAAQYAAGTPVTVWYVLAEPETAIVNEPLMKIGDYADTISFAQAGVTIPTVSGSNVLDTTSPVKPSEVYIKGKGIKAIT